MSGRLPRPLHALRAWFNPSAIALTPRQVTARERWQRRWNLPILLAAIVPLFATSPTSRALEIAIGVGSWIIFVIDLHVQRRIVPDYLRTRAGRFDLAIVVLTFPYYLIPGLGGYTAILLIARLARVARVLRATAGVRRVVARLGKVAAIAGLMVLFGALVAYGAEHSTNPGFATFGDALWWGLVTLTTVGYGDIVPTTRVGRLAGIEIMFMGIAVVGILAGSLASVFRLDQPKAGEQESEESGVAVSGPQPMHEELAALRSELQAVDQRLGELAERAQAGVGGPATGA